MKSLLKPSGRSLKASFRLFLLLLLLPAMAQAQEEKVILCLGDSITAGFGLLEKESYPALLQEWIRQKGLPYKVVNGGTTGMTSQEGHNRLPALLRHKEPRIVILELGVDDWRSARNNLDIKRNLGQIITTLRDHRVQVIVAGVRIPPFRGIDFASGFNAIYPQLSQEFNVPLIPNILEGVSDQRKMMQNDLFHPNPEGMKIVAHHIWTALEPLLHTTPPARQQ